MTVLLSFLRGALKLLGAFFATTFGTILVIALLNILAIGFWQNGCALTKSKADLVAEHQLAVQLHETDLVKLAECRKGSEDERAWYSSALREQSDAVDRYQFEGELAEQRVRIAEARAAEARAVTQTRIQVVYRDAPKADSTCADSMAWLAKQVRDFNARWAR